MRTSMAKSDDEADSPTSACLLDTAATDPLWPTLPSSSHDQILEMDNAAVCASLDFLSSGGESDLSLKGNNLSARPFDPCGRNHLRHRGRATLWQYMLSRSLPEDILSFFVLTAVFFNSPRMDTEGELHSCSRSGTASVEIVTLEGQSKIDECTRFHHNSVQSPSWLHPSSARHARRIPHSDIQRGATEACMPELEVCVANQRLVDAVPLHYRLSSSEDGHAFCSDDMLIDSSSSRQSEAVRRTKAEGMPSTAVKAVAFVSSQ